VLRLWRKIILANLKAWCSKMQPLSRNERPDLLTSRMHVSLVLRVPREIHLCRSSSNVPRLPTFLKQTHFWQRAESLAPSTRNRILTSKTAPRPPVFYTFDFEMCFAPPMPATRTHISYLQDVTQRAANKAPPADPLSNLPRKQEAFATRSGTIFHLAWTSSLHRLVGGSQTESLVKTLM
jgi:hypothetical protein